DGYYFQYEDKDQLRALQDRYRDKYLIKRAGGEVLAVPLRPSQPLSDWTACSFSIDSDWGVFERALEHGVRQLLRTKYPVMKVPPYGRILFSMQGEANDLVGEALATQRNLLSRLGFLHIYRK